jgi:hypothetical protein
MKLVSIMYNTNTSEEYTVPEIKYDIIAATGNCNNKKLRMVWHRLNPQ